MIRIYEMIRDVDATGNSGTGHVGEVVEFRDGTTIVHWSANTNAMGITSTVVYGSFEDAVKVHGHNGATRFVQLNRLPDQAPISEDARKFWDDIHDRGGTA